MCCTGWQQTEAPVLDAPASKPRFRIQVTGPDPERHVDAFDSVRTAGQTYHRSPTDEHAWECQHRREVGHGRPEGSVVHGHGLHPGDRPGEADYAVTGGAHRSSRRSGEIDPPVPRVAARGSERPDDGTAQGRRQSAYRGDNGYEPHCDPFFVAAPGAPAYAQGRQVGRVLCR